jgi:hypothetical protein
MQGNYYIACLNQGHEKANMLYHFTFTANN